MKPLFLLGPQRFEPNVAEIVTQLEASGPIAAITAGWQEREQELDELQEHLAQDVVNLRLYERSETILTEDHELAQALQRKKRSLRELQRLYRMRLDHAMADAREMMSLDGRDALVRDHRQASIRALRTLDRQHLTRIQRLHEEFDQEWQPHQRDAVARQRDEVLQEIDGAGAIAIAGGHVAVLLNRLRLFALDDVLPTRPIVAWSAGAMALTERVVLFHDSPPQGAGNAEVFEAGLGCTRGLIALPHASQRLNLDDPVRVALMARRFRPDMTALLDPGTVFERTADGWRGRQSARTLAPRGAVVRKR